MPLSRMKWILLAALLLLCALIATAQTVSTDAGADLKEVGSKFGWMGLCVYMLSRDVGPKILRAIKGTSASKNTEIFQLDKADGIMSVEMQALKANFDAHVIEDRVNFANTAEFLQNIQRSLGRIEGRVFER